MNRKIIFRGLRVDNNEWVYGSLVTATHLGERAYILYDVGGISIQVKPESVGQYTGLKDKNNVEIFEGDILQGGLANNGVITFENGTFTIWNQPLGWDVEDYDEKPEIYLPEEWATVIGNIHQNPELIKK